MWPISPVEAAEAPAKLCTFLEDELGFPTVRTAPASQGTNRDLQTLGHGWRIYFIHGEIHTLLHRVQLGKLRHPSQETQLPHGL